MTRHPLQSVLQQLDYQPSAGFREALRARLLDDLATTTEAAPSGNQTDAGDGVDEPQEITVLDKNDRPPTAEPRY